METKSTPKCSVVIPVYNVEPYLRETITSVLSQTLQDIEIICVNDGSTDGSLSILKEYGEKDSRVVVIDKQNTGVGDSRNVGINAAKGEYIAFLDSDDMFASDDVLEILYNKAKESGCKICGGNPARNVNGVTYDMPFGRYPAMFFDKEGVIEFKDFQFNYGFYDFIYEKELLVKNNVRFPGYIRYQDPPFMVRAMAAAGRFYALNKTVYVYRVEHKEIDWNRRRVDDLFAAFEDVWQFATEQKLERLKEYIWQQMKDHKQRVLPNLTEQQAAFMESVSEYIAARNVISVVVPVYNAGPYLREAMDSLINQTYPLLEIICVNDGSKDNSLEILQEYAAADSRIKIIDKENGGYGKAMNTGLAVATGKYFAILEPDDILPLNAYTNLLTAAENAAADIAKGCISAFIGEGETRKTTWKSSFNPKYLGRVFAPRREQGIFRAIMNTVTAIYRLDFMRKHGVCYNESPGASYQDNSLYMLGFAYADRLVCINSVVYNYRRDNENSSVNAVNGKLDAHRHVYSFLRERLEKTPEIWETVKPAFLLRRMQSHNFIFGKMSNAKKLEYLEKFREELIEMEDFDPSMLSMKEKWEMTTIIQSPMVYMIAAAVQSYPQPRAPQAPPSKSEAQKNKNKSEVRKNLFYSKSPNKKAYKILGIPVFAIRKKNNNTLYCVLGIPVVKKTNSK